MKYQWVVSVSIINGRKERVGEVEKERKKNVGRGRKSEKEEEEGRRRGSRRRNEEEMRGGGRVMGEGVGRGERGRKRGKGEEKVV